MSFIELFAQHDPIVLITLGLLSLLAGFIDAVVGGGGLFNFPL